MDRRKGNNKGRNEKASHTGTCMYHITQVNTSRDTLSHTLKKDYG